MANKCIVIISGMVDTTIREYQPDVEFLLFRSVDAFAAHTQTVPVRAELLFMTKDIVGVTNAVFSHLYRLITENDYIAVDKVIYITEQDSQELVSLQYLIEEYNIENWSVVQGSMTRAFITEVVNGTFREDTFNVHRKAVYRQPKADYVKQQLRNKDSLNEAYADDESDLQDIPDLEIPTQDVSPQVRTLRKVFIAGDNKRCRTAFAILAAQYLSKTDKVLLIESDPDYHNLTECVTKAGIDATVFTITNLYEDATLLVDNLRKAEGNLVIIEAIDRIDFDYRFVLELLYHNMINSYNYIIDEISLNEIPQNVDVTVVVPSTITGVLSACEQIDKSYVPFCRFVAVNLEDLPETHVNNGTVLSKIINDVLAVNSAVCPVVTIHSLRLNGQAYDLSGVLGKGVLL